MKKILVGMFLLIFGLCLVGCNLLEKDKNVTCKKYENCAVFTFTDFSANETISFELERTCLGDGTIYYQVNLIAGVLSINYQERWHEVVQPLGEFSADDEMPINGAGGYVEQDKITIIFESYSPIVGEIIIAFTEESLSAVQGNLQYHNHTFTYTSSGEVGHYTHSTCGCPSEEGTTPHYDENCDYLCDACECDMTKFADEWQYDETHHWYESDTGEVYCYGEHENSDADLSCDICGCGVELQVPTNHFLRNQSGYEWLNENNAADITEVKIITESVGVAPGSFKNVSTSSDVDVIAKLYEDIYWLDSNPIPKEEGQIYGGGATTIRFILNDGASKEIYINNGNYKDINGNYYELIYIPKFSEYGDYISSYVFVTYQGHAQIYDSYDKAICSIPINEIEFAKVIDEIVLEGKPVTHYLETEFGKVYFISEIYFYIDGIVEGDIFNGESKPIYYQLIDKSLDDIICQYSIVPE